MVSKTVYDEYLRSLIEGNKSNCCRIVFDLLDDGTDIKSLYKYLFHNSLYEVGVMWENNEISVSVEHIATAITESILARIYPKLPVANNSGKKAIISCTPDEFHQVGGRIVADVFEMHGWDTYFLGANTPVNELLKLIDKKEPDVVGLSVSIYFNMNNCVHAVQNIRRSFPNIDIILGGQAFQWNSDSLIQKLKGCIILNSIDDAEKEIIGE